MKTLTVDGWTFSWNDQEDTQEALFMALQSRAEAQGRELNLTLGGLCDLINIAQELSAAIQATEPDITDEFTPAQERRANEDFIRKWEGRRK